MARPCRGAEAEGRPAAGRPAAGRGAGGGAGRLVRVQLRAQGGGPLGVGVGVAHRLADLALELRLHPDGGEHAAGGGGERAGGGRGRAAAGARLGLEEGVLGADGEAGCEVLRGVGGRRRRAARGAEVALGGSVAADSVCTWHCVGRAMRGCCAIARHVLSAIRNLFDLNRRELGYVLADGRRSILEREAAQVCVDLAHEAVNLG